MARWAPSLIISKIFFSSHFFGEKQVFETSAHDIFWNWNKKKHFLSDKKNHVRFVSVGETPKKKKKMFT